MKHDGRRGACAFALLAPLGVLLFLDPIPQSTAYHDFADQRALFDTRNFADVASNLAFLVVGVWGLAGASRWEAPEARLSWRIFFGATVLVAFASGWYHLSPSNATLVWDRMAISVICAALLVALLTEHVAPGVQRLALPPALLVAAGSVLYWQASGDLRLYIWVQLAPLLAVPVVILCFPARYSHRPWLLAGLSFYLGAKLAEMADAAIWGLSGGAFSGHTLKHLLAALPAAVVHLMLLRRRALFPDTGESEGVASA